MLGEASAQAQPSTVQASSTASADAIWIKGKWQVGVAGGAVMRTLDVSNAREQDGATYALDSTYGVADTKLQSVSAELRKTGDKWMLRFATPINATISAESTDQKVFSGTITYKNGVAKPLKIEMSSAARHRLSHDEIAAMLIGQADDVRAQP